MLYPNPLYPNPLSRSIKIVHGQQTYPLTTRMLYPLPISQSIQILRSSSSPSYPITSELLYPTPPTSSIKTVGSSNSRDVKSKDVVVAAGSPKPSGIRIMLSDKIVYPFTNGIYPPARRILVENGELSGALEGLDRVERTESGSVPLFRFGFPFYLELESSEPTRESPLSFIQASQMLSLFPSIWY